MSSDTYSGTVAMSLLPTEILFVKQDKKCCRSINQYVTSITWLTLLPQVSVLA